MTGNLQRRRSAASICLALLVSADMQAMRQDAGLLRMSIGMPDTDEFVFAHMAAYRSYVELQELKFAITLGNEAPSPVLIDQGVFRSAFSVLVKGDDEMPVRVRWSDEIQVADSPRPVQTIPDSSVAIDAGRQITWTFTVRPVDGSVFRFGDYAVVIGVTGVRRAASPAGGGTWTGRIVEGVHERFVSIRAPQSRAETVRLHILAAAAAEDRQDFDAAVEATTLALAADPTNGGISGRRAVQLLAARRYVEAVAAFEEIAARNGIASPDFARMLAHAYVGAGDEGNARRVLRGIGRSEGAVSDDLETFRSMVRSAR